MSESMVERVARAIYEDWRGGGDYMPPWENLGRYIKGNWLAHGRAAVAEVFAALRDPSPEMVEAGALAMNQELKRQMDGQPLPVPGEYRPENWSATGGEINLTVLAADMFAAMLTAAEGGKDAK